MMTSKRSKKPTKKRRAKPPPKRKASKANGAELTAFMLDKLGGEEMVKADFAKLKFGEAVAAGLSITGIIAAGKKEGWFEAVKDIPLSELLPRRKASAKRGRKPRAVTAVLRASIVKALDKKPKAAKDIAKALGEPARVVQTQLAKLVSEGLAKRQGSRRNATYSA